MFPVQSNKGHQLLVFRLEILALQRERKTIIKDKHSTYHTRDENGVLIEEDIQSGVPILRSVLSVEANTLQYYTGQMSILQECL